MLRIYCNMILKFETAFTYPRDLYLPLKYSRKYYQTSLDDFSSDNNTQVN